MIGTELVEEFVRSVAVSHLVNQEKPVSCLLVADRESGKTTVVEAAKCEFAETVSIITGIGMLRIIQNRKIPPKIIILNDLVSIKGFRSSVVTLLASILNGFTEEGIFRIALPNGTEMDFGGIRGSLIACITPDALMDQRNRWYEMGFMSRTIPFCYSLPQSLVIDINDAIETANKIILSSPDSLTNHKRKLKNAAIELSPMNASHIRDLAETLAVRLSERGIRLHKLLRSLAKSHALLKHGSAVEDTDIQFLHDVSYYIHYPPKAEFVRSVHGNIYQRRPRKWLIPELGSHVNKGEQCVSVNAAPNVESNGLSSSIEP